MHLGVLCGHSSWLLHLELLLIQAEGDSVMSGRHGAGARSATPQRGRVHRDTCCGHWGPLEVQSVGHVCRQTTCKGQRLRRVSHHKQVEVIYIVLDEVKRAR
jgi:hypothetical protein